MHRSISHLRIVAALTILAGGCHPLSCFHPADLPRDPPLVLESEDAWPREQVAVDVDELGIPHIFAQSEPDAAYALGVMHARDRLFQIFLYIHAGQGRLTELLGADLIEIDRANRILTWGLDAQLAQLEPREGELFDAYIAGLNEGARQVGRSAEMAILGVDWEPVTRRDVLSVVRLQQWDQSAGMNEELARLHVVKHLGAEHPVAAALLKDAPSGGVPIVGSGEHDGAPFEAGAARTGFHVPPPRPASERQVLASSSWNLMQRALAHDVAARFRRGGTGASNSWSLAPDKTAAGVAVLANDPHLAHAAPGVFYMVDMHITEDGEEHIVAGGSFPGIPAVLIGHGKHMAWGITNAYADTQDLVVLAPREGRNDSYVVDGQAFAFEEWPQTFKLGKDKDASVVRETYQASIFGPVLPPGYGSYGGAPPAVDGGERVALLWTAQQFPEDSSGALSAFWDLARSKDIEAATAAVQRFAAPAMSFNLAFTDGTIAYRLSGVVPVRGDAQRVDFPRQGTSRSAGWAGRVPAAQKPQLTNPEQGYIVAANQRVVDNDMLSQRFVGFEAAEPFRALRIHARLRQLLENGKPTSEELLSIQQDVVSIKAQELAPILGAHCPKEVAGHDERRVQDFCAALKTFDGAFTVDALATPYARVQRELVHSLLRAHLPEPIALDIMNETFIQMAVLDAITAEDGGTPSPLFDDPSTDGHDGLPVFVARAVQAGLDIVVEEAGGSEGDWRWGKLHTLSLRGALSSAPVIGGLFQTFAREEAGAGGTPRAEAADFSNKLRVRTGAGLRLLAEMSDPPVVRMVNDSGNSGHFGHRHLEDQYPLWTAGDPRVLSLSREDAKATREGALTIAPRD